MAEPEDERAHGMELRPKPPRQRVPHDQEYVYLDEQNKRVESDPEDNVNYDYVSRADVSLWGRDAGDIISVSSASSSNDTDSDGDDGQNGDGNNGNAELDKWAVVYGQSEVYQRRAFRDFPPRKRKKFHRRGYLRREYSLSKFRKFTKEKLDLTKDCSNKICKIVKNFQRGRGYQNKAWDIAFLEGKEITTLDYDFNELVKVAKLAQDTLGDSKKGYLALALNHLRRYQHYVKMKNELEDGEFRRIEDWRTLLMNH